VREGEAGILDERRTPTGKPSSAGVALEKSNADLVLEISDLAREGLLGHVQTQSGS
jgi:hypothetical protein